MRIINRVLNQLSHVSKRICNRLDLLSELRPKVAQTSSLCKNSSLNGRTNFAHQFANSLRVDALTRLNLKHQHFAQVHRNYRGL